LDCLLEQRRPWLEPHHEQSSVRRPCQWLGVNRARWDYQPVDERVEHLHLLRWLDEP
jgi:putative transposase